MKEFNFRRKLYIGVAIAALIVAINALANDLSWYWLFKWLDNPMHVAGGFMAGYFGIFTYLTYRHFHADRRRNLIQKSQIEEKPTEAQISLNSKEISAAITTDKFSIWIPLLASFLVGIIWELVENHFGLSGLSAYFIFDTIKDIINDMIGGVISFIVWNLCYIRSNNQ